MYYGNVVLSTSQGGNADPSAEDESASTRLEQCVIVDEWVETWCVDPAARECKVRTLECLLRGGLLFRIGISLYVTGSRQESEGIEDGDDENVRPRATRTRVAGIPRRAAGKTEILLQTSRHTRCRLVHMTLPPLSYFVGDFWGVVSGLVSVKCSCR